MSANQNLTSGSTDITFDEEGSWNNDGGYITHSSGTTDFTVVQAGLYQLEWNTTITANGATWTTTSNKFISIDVTRSPAAEQAIIGQSAFMASGTNYSQSVCSTFDLVAGDVINCRIVNTFTGGPPQALGVANTFDLNTWFSWRYVSTGGGGGGGVESIATLTGVVTLSSPDASISIGVGEGNDISLQAVIPAAPVQSVGAKTGDVTFGTGEGIAIDYGAENTDPITISSTVVGIETSGTVDATGFTEQEVGPYIGQYYKDVTVTGLYANGVVVCSTSGTPEISAIAWITTVVLATNKITIWTAADPVGGGGTWEAHYIVASYGSAPP
jgi:hypothetical protein